MRREAPTRRRILGSGRKAYGTQEQSVSAMQPEGRRSRDCTSETRVSLLLHMEHFKCNLLLAEAVTEWVSCFLCEKKHFMADGALLAIPVRPAPCQQELSPPLRVEDFSRITGVKSEIRGGDSQRHR